MKYIRVSVKQSGVYIMQRLLITFCIFSLALGNKYEDYKLRKPDYGQRRQADLDPVTLEEMDNKASMTAEDEKNDSNEPAVTAEDRNDANEPSLTAEDKNESNEPSLMAEDTWNDANEPDRIDSDEPSLTAEDTNNANEPSLMEEDTRNDSNEPNLITVDNGNYPDDRNLNDNYLAYNAHYMDAKLDEQRYKVELAAGDPTEFRSGNQHFHDPHFYANLGRRFVPVYPYTEVKKKFKKLQVEDLKPRWAPKAVVLAVMKEAIKNRPALRPSEDEDFNRQNILRSGDYFDGVWKEEVKPGNILRTNKNNRHKHARNKEELNSLPITAKLLPGTKLYDLISGVVRQSPRLVYIINDE